MHCYLVLVAGLVPQTLSTRGFSAPLRGGRATLAQSRPGPVSPSPVSSRPPSEGAQPGKVNVEPMLRHIS